MIVSLVVIVILQSCSIKKNRAATRNYHAFVTRYNILYNGESRYREAVDDMIATFEDNDSIPLSPHPADVMAGAKSTRFDYSIKKAQKAILLHSITSRPRGKAGHSRDPEYRKWMNRKEYNPALADAWLLLGNCYYMKGRFDDAALLFATAEFRFAHDPKMVEVCRIMQARCRADMGWKYEAEMMLDRVDEKLLGSKQSKYLYYSTRSIIDANNGENKRATESALMGVKYAPNSILASRLNRRAAMLAMLPSEPKVAIDTIDFVLPESCYVEEPKRENQMEVSASIVLEKDPLPFTFSRDAPHQVVFTFDADVISVNKLIYEIACFNFAKFDTADFDITRVGGNLSVGQFDNYDDAQSYIKMFVDSNRELMNNIMLTPISTTDFELMSNSECDMENYKKSRAEAWSINEIN